MIHSSEEPGSQFVLGNIPEAAHPRLHTLNLPVLRGTAFAGIDLPTYFPDVINLPKYPLGSRCRWVPNPATDWGTVIGQIYVPSRTEDKAATQWIWAYLLLLDSNSPSRQWLAADWVDEESLEPLPIESTL
jgi:hypothetical protein